MNKCIYRVTYLFLGHNIYLIQIHIGYISIDFKILFSGAPKFDVGLLTI
jgi:hypothetical protein